MSESPIETPTEDRVLQNLPIVDEPDVLCVVVGLPFPGVWVEGAGAL